MDMIIEITNQDMATAIEALKKDEFDLINIIGNRIATDLMIGNKNGLSIGKFEKEINPSDINRKT
ncbi:hypothetical protein C5S36_14690 [Candidatus Methanophagaceae archaeon]|jgi:hypothetical protein|nr:hypothetical protein C5S36_14690 [Methanophagales archaeon]